MFGPNRVLTGFYGQEIILATYNLARINMFLHNVWYDKFSLAHCGP
ncbi:N-6 DNA methylase [Dermabacteraceae bacterium P13138]